MTSEGSDSAAAKAATTEGTKASPADAIATAAVTTPVQVATPEIRWHCGPTGLNEAVLSLDFLHDRSSASTPTILATGGADKEIKLWRVLPDVTDNAGLEFVFSLTGHDRSVNCVRFSPNGQYLASASDDSTVIIWTKPKTAAVDWSWDKMTSFSDISRTLLACGHKGDITDICWSPDSVHLCSGSVDNCSVIWNVEKGEVVERRKDHTQYVQGVAWDPLGEFLVTEGNDRTCRVYSLTGFDAISRQSNSKKQVRKCANMLMVKTREFPPAKGAAADGSVLFADEEPKDDAMTAKGPPKHRMFLDDTCPVFARRLSWTPCGSYLLAPTGVFRAAESAAAVNTVYAFARGNMSKPALHLPGQEKASLGVRCNPLLYKLRDTAAASYNFFRTPHRSIFAVITLNAVIVYDSQQQHPICTIKNLHYADLTDATWSTDGQILSVASMDGYISFIRFEDGFFGSSVPPEELVRTNEEAMRTMFTVSKTVKKRMKSHAVAAATEDPSLGSNNPTASAKTPSQAKKKLVAITSPLLQAFQKRDSSALDGDAPKLVDVLEATQAVVNTLQVRKKRKIAPTSATEPAPNTSESPERIDLTEGSDALSSKTISTKLDDAQKPIVLDDA